MAIVFPSIILGALAYRGVINDQALVEREQRREFQESGQQLNEAIDTDLKLIESSFLNIADTAQAPEKILFSDSSLLSFINQHSFIENAFYLSSDNEVSILNNGFLFVPDNYELPKPELVSEKVQTILDIGWQLELVQKEYSKAVDLYENSIGGISNVKDQGEIYNAMARVQKKLGEPAEAIKTYQTLYNSCPDVYIRGNIPLGMVALLESGLQYLEIQDTISCLETLNVLLVNIKDSRWTINYPTYSNVVSKIEETITLMHNPKGEKSRLVQRSKSLLKGIYALEKRTAYVFNIQTESGVFLSGQGSNPNNSISRYLFNQDGNSYYVYLSPDEVRGQWGLMYDQGVILQNILKPYLLEIAEESVFDWEVVDDYEEVLLQSEIVTKDVNPIKVVFSSSLPSWTLVIYPKRGGILISFVQTSEGIFFYIFLLIIIILAFGLFFTLYVVNNELRVSKMKSNFISTVSHEFKSPLTSIRQMAEMLYGGRVPAKERQQKYYSSMLQETERLSHLIDNILDFSRMEEGRKNFRFGKGNLTDIVEEMVLSFQSQMKDKGFRIDFILPGPIPDSVFDKEAINQVLQNLIENACKYSGESKTIEVSLTYSEPEIIIAVKDYGIGISKDEQDKIFSRFYRAGNELTQKVKGSGIGLTIVKQIVNAHQGSIRLQSEPGKGSVFRVILPLTINNNR